jgi:hypothetical protein
VSDAARWARERARSILQSFCSTRGKPTVTNSLVIKVEQELMVQPLDILQRRDALLQILIPRSSMNRVIDLSKHPHAMSQPPPSASPTTFQQPVESRNRTTHHDPIHPILLISFQNSLLHPDLDTRLIPLILPGSTDPTELVVDSKGFAGFLGKLRKFSVVGRIKGGRREGCVDYGGGFRFELIPESMIIVR